MGAVRRPVISGMDVRSRDLLALGEKLGAMGHASSVSGGMAWVTDTAESDTTMARADSVFSKNEYLVL